jgi:hypothetical protein
MRIDSAIITGSFSINGDTFNDLGAYTTTGSNAFTGSQNITGSLVVSGSFNLTESASAFQIQGNGFGQTYLQSPNGAIVLNPGYGGVEITGVNNRFNVTDGYITNLYASNGVVSGSSQIVDILSPLNSFTSSTNTKINSLEEKTGSLATTGSNTFFGTQTFSGSVYVKENLIVQGSSSLQNITASAVDIGTNRIILNVNNPSVRYAGISVYDSGSTAGTGSLFWDSVENHWLYEHPSDSAAPYNSAILISGPKNSGNLGEELELVNNYIVKAVGGDHISSSAIYDDGNIISLKSNTEITGSLKVNSVLTTNGQLAVGNNMVLYGANKHIQFDAGASSDLFISCIPGTRTIEIRNGNAGAPNYAACGLITGYASFKGGVSIDAAGDNLTLTRSTFASHALGVGTVTGINGLHFNVGSTTWLSVTESGIPYFKNNIYQSNADGSVSSNKFSTYNGGATDMNFSYPAGGSVTFTNGTPRLTIASTGAATFSGNLAINNTLSSPGNLIETAGLNLYLRPASGYKVFVDTGDGLDVTSGVARLSNLRTSTLFSEFTKNLSGAYSNGTYYTICNSSELSGAGIYIVVAYVDTYAIGGGTYFATYASVPFYWFAGGSNSNSTLTLPTMMGTGHHNLNPPTIRLRLDFGGNGGLQYLEFNPNADWSNVQGVGGATVTFYVKRLGS